MHPRLGRQLVQGLDSVGNVGKLQVCARSGVLRLLVGCIPTPTYPQGDGSWMGRMGSGKATTPSVAWWLWNFDLSRHPDSGSTRLRIWPWSTAEEYAKPSPKNGLQTKPTKNTTAADATAACWWRAVAGPSEVLRNNITHAGPHGNSASVSAEFFFILTAQSSCLSQLYDAHCRSH